MTGNVCGATIEFGDDFGDNSSTFRCGKPLQHEGDHCESGSMYDKNPYTLAWTVDDRLAEVEDIEGLLARPRDGVFDDDYYVSERARLERLKAEIAEGVPSPVLGEVGA